MTNAATIRELGALGLTIDQIAGVIEVMERRGAEKRAANRERMRVVRARSRTDEHDGALARTPSPKETSPIPPKEITPSTSLRSENEKSGARGTRLPETFVPDEAEAFRIGLTPAEAQTEAAKFLDFWRAKSGADATKRDWPATWRNWCRNALERRRSGTGPPYQRPQQSNGWAALGRKLADEGHAANESRNSPERNQPAAHQHLVAAGRAIDLLEAGRSERAGADHAGADPARSRAG